MLYWKGWRTVAALAAFVVAVTTVAAAVGTFRVSLQTLQTNTRQQASDRFVKAVDQLGSNNLDIRLGGIYGMEELARDSPTDYPAVFGVLTSFIREHAPRKDERCRRGQSPSPEHAGHGIGQDIQAVIDAIGNRDRRNDPEPHFIDLSLSCLAVARFEKKQFGDVLMFQADLWGADLFDAHLENADLNDSILDHALMEGAHLSHSLLSGASLVHAFLCGADLSRANLRDAHLPGAHLGNDANITDDSKCSKGRPAILAGTNLSGADLTGAHLSGVDLSNATLDNAKLNDISYSSSTKWPTGFQPPPNTPEGN